MSAGKNQNDASRTLRDEKQRLVQEMLRRRRAANERPADTIEPRDRTRPAKLSFAQQRLWFLELLSPDSPGYVFANLITLNGPLDTTALEKSLAEIVQRHENLRTHFQELDGDLVQIVDNNFQFALSIHDLSDLPGERRDQALQEKAHTLSRVSFDLSVAPLFRAELVRIDEDRHVLIMVLHHIIYDGWSLGVLFDELKELYISFRDEGAATMAPLSIQYADFSMWQREKFQSEEWQRQFDYWTNQLRAPLPSLQLPTDRKRPDVQDFEGRVHWFYLPRALSANLNSLARREDCTLFMVLITAFNVLLHRLTGETDILVGSPIAGRNHRDVEPLIGFFVNTLVIRTDLTDNPAFCDLLQKVRETTAEAYANQDVPFESLVDALLPERLANQNPIFQTMFALENTPPPPDNLGDVSMQIAEFDNGTSVFDLTLSMYENDDGVSGYFEYSTALFDESTIDRICEAFQVLLRAFADNPERPIGDPSLIGTADQNLIFGQFNDTNLDYRRDRNVIDLFRAACQENPNSVAIVAEDSQLSYEELSRRSEVIMRRLLEHGIQPNEFVGVCLNRSADMFATILGIMKAGAAYLPLDPGYPAPRLQFIASDSQTRLVLYSDSLDIDVQALFGTATMLCVEDLELERRDDTTMSFPEARAIEANDFAYAIYTSGSTGKPKAVPITHANLIHSDTARVNYYSSSVSAFLLLSSFSFDSSIAGIFWTLCTGGKLVLPKEGQERDIFAIDELISSNSISHILCLPSVYSLLLDNARDNSLASLDVACVAGEECPRALVEKHFKTLPNTALYNEYGPTEGTVWSTVYKCREDDAESSVSIGQPISNVEVFILDDYGNSQPIGIEGEICIAGDGVANGYLNRPELTEQKFKVQTLEDGLSRRIYRTGDLGRFRRDGNIEFLGRIDDQVKVNGYRIEIPEIENAILGLSHVKEVAVTVHRGVSGDNRLVAYVASSRKNLEDIGVTLRDLLPSYMLPDLYVPVNALPVTPNGKVNKAALPDPLTEPSGSENNVAWPETPMQRAMESIWKSILEKDRFGVDMDFFASGGNSILATRVISKIHHSFGQKLPVRFMFEYPTIRSLADKILADSDDCHQLEQTAAMMIMIDEMSEEELDKMLELESGRLSS